MVCPAIWHASTGPLSERVELLALIMLVAAWLKPLLLELLLVELNILPWKFFSELLAMLVALVVGGVESGLTEETLADPSVRLAVLEDRLGEALYTCIWKRNKCWV